jgi:hypothetical protein
MKLSKRRRYILKWNGPDGHTRRARQYVNARRGKGPASSREVNTIYWCRLHGFYPESMVEWLRLSGTAIKDSTP